MVNAGEFSDRVPRRTFLGTLGAMAAAGAINSLEGGNVCPNSPYRDYVLACVDEICRGYDIDGIFFGMTFWPAAVCTCRHCEARF